MKNVDFFTKYHSNRNYINEIVVEGKRTNKFYFQIAYYDQYIAQVIRFGNALSLLSISFELNRDNFWNTHYFEDISRFIFWTFNKSFLLALEEKINCLSVTTVNRCIQLLQENISPYQIALTEFIDQELRWCTVKNSFLQNNPNFKKMYELDKQNRTKLMEALEKRQNLLSPGADEKKKNNIYPEIINTSNEDTFLAMLKPIEGSSQKTLAFIIDKVAEAAFEYEIFSQVPRLLNGKNPYGLNSTILSVIDHFFQLGYFNKNHSLENILKAYCAYSGNHIGKLKVYLSEFRQDKRYQKNIAQLKLLKINKLN